mmetsp:Transcript_3778/g.8780  ORF Transcript_3778/g.8780 Transcript_3778/m.8780 type:complete len:92 (+) Transcript_3778:300-575(+)
MFPKPATDSDKSDSSPFPFGAGSTQVSLDEDVLGWPSLVPSAPLACTEGRLNSLIPSADLEEAGPTVLKGEAVLVESLGPTVATGICPHLG